jgi:uncharacterized protein YbjT (DUF2867 family)
VNVLVTGASGFLGGHVVPLLVTRGDTVTALARSQEAADRVTALGATPVHGDLDDPASIDEAFAASGADTLANLVSLGFGHAPAIVAAAEEAGLKRAVFVSTTAIFTTLNAGSKAKREAAENTIRASALDWTILRPTMIYGTPKDRNMARLLRLIRRSPVVPLPGGGRRLQQPVHVDDLAAAVAAALDFTTAPASRHQAYDIAGPEPLTFRRIVEEAAAALDRHPRLLPVPLPPLIGVLRLYERLAPNPRLKSEQLERLAEDKAFDIGPARRDLGYAPRSFAEGMAQEVALLSSRP